MSDWWEGTANYKAARRQKAPNEFHRPKGNHSTRKRYHLQVRYPSPFNKKNWDAAWWTKESYRTEKHMLKAFEMYIRRGTLYGTLKAEFRCKYPNGRLFYGDNNAKPSP